MLDKASSNRNNTVVNSNIPTSLFRKHGNGKFSGQQIPDLTRVFIKVRTQYMPVTVSFLMHYDTFIYK